MKLQGTRCAVRQWHMDDADSLVRQADNINVARQLRDRFPHPYTRANASAFLKAATSAPEPSNLAIEVDGQSRRPEGTGGMVGWRYVTPGYFNVLGIPLVRGRRFTEEDRLSGAFVAILSESLARRIFPNEDPIGKRLLRGPEGQWTTVIGVARDVTNLGATRES